MATRPGPIKIDDVRYIPGPDGTGTPKTVTPRFYEELDADFDFSHRERVL